MFAVSLGGLGVRKFWVARRTLLASNCVKRLKTAQGFERELQVACQVSVLALEMTEDALRDASTYARRWASEHALRLSRTANSSSSNHHALGGRPRRPKRTESLAAFKRSDEKDRAGQWIFCASSIGRGRVLRDVFFEFIPTSLFEVEFRGSSIGMANGSKLQIDVYGEVVGSQTWEGVPFACGS